MRDLKDLSTQVTQIKTQAALINLNEPGLTEQSKHAYVLPHMFCFHA